MDDWALDPTASPATARIGREGEPLVRIDGVLRAPDALVDYAAHRVTFAPAWGPAGGYPGLRAPAPLDYVERMVRALDPLLRDVFDVPHAARLGRAECNFSLVTQPPGDLVASQRVPHVDTDDPLQFAILHYLCDAAHGGTAFYRHVATGFETITPERAARFAAIRADEEERSPVPAGYIIGDSPQFVRIAACDARYNRLVAYRSRLLHSGIIPADASLDPDPRRGRLTANIFLSYRG